MISVAVDQVLRETLAYHRAMRERAVRSRVLHFEGPALELISPRLPAGQAVSELIVAESAFLDKDSIDGHTQAATAGFGDLDDG